MAFFSKLKERLFKSSSKIDEGLDAIVEDGGEVDEGPVGQEPDPTREPQPDPAPEPQPDPVPEPQPTPSPLPEPEPMPEPQPEPVQIPEPAPVPDTPSDPLPEPYPEEIPQTEPYSDPGPVALAEESAPAEKPGFMARMLGRTSAAPVVRRVMDDDMLEQIEELLITSDMGVDTAMRVSANMAEGRFGRKFSTGELKELMAGEVARIMEPVAKPMPIFPKRPQVVLVVGVNGSGKTTTIGKLASQFKAAGKSVVIAAGDTFRAAAVEQLQVWGGAGGGAGNDGGAEGSDPASLWPSTP